MTMCTATSGTKTATGQTWTPTERMTDEQRRTRFQTNLATNNQTAASGGSLLTGSSADRSPFANNSFSAAARTTMQENVVHDQRADADQRKLAAWDRQEAKRANSGAEGVVATANRRRNAGTLVTGGVSMGGAAPTGRTTLLGG